jgi:hypothetical protein
VNVWPWLMIWGEFAGLAPVGTVSQTTSWGAELSWSENVTTVPGATVTLAGEKFSVVSVPTFWGITIVTEPPVAGEEVAVVVLVEVGVLVLVAVLVVEVAVIEDVVTADEEDVVVDATEVEVVLGAEEEEEEEEDTLVLDAGVEEEEDATVVLAEFVLVVVSVELDDVLEEDVLVYTATSCVAEVIETVRILLVDPVSAQCENVYAP